MDTIKNDCILLLTNHRLPDIIETIALLVERKHLTQQVAGKASDPDVETLLESLENAAEVAHKLRLKNFEIS